MEWIWIFESRAYTDPLSAVQRMWLELQGLVIAVVVAVIWVLLKRWARRNSCVKNADEIKQ